MDIVVTYHDGKWVTDPSPAIVLVGTRIRWVFRTPDLEGRSLQWSIIFKENKPFGDEVENLVVKTNTLERQGRETYDDETLRQLDLPPGTKDAHRGETEVRPAGRPGEFKYDLRLQDARNQRVIGDDDPWLIVIKGILRPVDHLGFY